MKKRLLCGFVALLTLLIMCIAPVMAYCDIIDPGDIWQDGYPKLIPYQNNIFYTQQDTTLTVNEIACNDGFSFSVFATEAKHGILVFHETGGMFSVNDGPFTYTPDAGFTGWDSFTYGCRADTQNWGYCYGPTTTQFIYVGDGHPVPEFPTTFLPVTLIVGFIATVLFIQRTRDQ